MVLTDGGVSADDMTELTLNQTYPSATTEAGTWTVTVTSSASSAVQAQVYAICVQ